MTSSGPDALARVAEVMAATTGPLPYAQVAEKAGIGADEALRCLRELQAAGKVRRYGTTRLGLRYEQAP